MGFFDDMQKIAGLWMSKSGRTWTGTIDTAEIPRSGVMRLVLIPNDKEGNEKRPDFQLFIGANKRTGPGQFRADKQIDEARKAHSEAQQQQGDEDIPF
jgi:uncharacterized protein (DUF736 family)